MKPAVLLAGDTAYGEFVDAVAWLNANCKLAIAADFEAGAALAQAEPPVVIVLAVARPGQFPVAEVERIHNVAPLARLVVLLGSWCEGETRTGQPWAGVIRVYWHQWAHRAPVEFARLLKPQQASGWKLPRTASNAERLLAAPPQPIPLSLRTAIWAEDAAAYAAVADAVRATGSTAVRVENASEAADFDLLIFDAPDFRADTQQLLKTFVQSTAPCIALMNFPRSHEVATAAPRCVVSKPYLLTDLWSAMQTAAGAAAPPLLLF